MTKIMSKKEPENTYDFSNAKRGAILPHKGKIRVTIWLDEDVIAKFREEADTAGEGYQTRINRALRREVFGDPVTIAVREAVRAEISAMLGSGPFVMKKRTAKAAKAEERQKRR